MGVLGPGENLPDLAERPRPTALATAASVAISVAAVAAGIVLVVAGVRGWPDDQTQFDEDGQETTTPADIAAGIGVLALAFSPFVFVATRRALNPDGRQFDRERAAARRAAEEADRLDQERRKTAAESARDARKMAERDAYEEIATTVGTEPWKRRRHNHHMQEVLERTGVHWKRSMFSDARSPREMEARSIMNSLRAEDRRLVREAEQAEVDAKLRRLGVLTSPRAAEVAMCDWLRRLGVDAETTRSGSDGGIDISGAGVAAQVKFWRRKRVGRPAVQALAGAAEDRRALFFAFHQPGYTQEALDWAEDNFVALFTFNESAQVDSVNYAADEWLDELGSVSGKVMSRAEAIRWCEQWMVERYLSPISRLESGGSVFRHPKGLLRLFWRNSPATRSELQSLLGADGASDDAHVICMAQAEGGFSATAVDWAEQNGMALYLVESSVSSPVTSAARRLESIVQLQRGS